MTTKCVIILHVLFSSFLFTAFFSVFCVCSVFTDSPQFIYFVDSNWELNVKLSRCARWIRWTLQWHRPASRPTSNGYIQFKYTFHYVKKVFFGVDLFQVGVYGLAFVYSFITKLVTRCLLLFLHSLRLRTLLLLFRNEIICRLFRRVNTVYTDTRSSI